MTPSQRSQALILLAEPGLGTVSAPPQAVPAGREVSPAPGPDTTQPKIRALHPKTITPHTPVGIPQQDGVPLPPRLVSPLAGRDGDRAGTGLCGSGFLPSLGENVFFHPRCVPTAFLAAVFITDVSFQASDNGKNPDLVFQVFVRAYFSQISVKVSVFLLSELAFKDHCLHFDVEETEIKKKKKSQKRVNSCNF